MSYDVRQRMYRISYGMSRTLTKRFPSLYNKRNLGVQYGGGLNWCKTDIGEYNGQSVYGVGEFINSVVVTAFGKNIVYLI